MITNTMMVSKTKLYSIIASVILSIPFLYADIGFSYDYQYYLKYIDEVAILSLVDLYSLLNGWYVDLNYSAGIEFGFILLIKLITLIVNDAEVVYAIIVFLSIYIKVNVMRRLKVPWIAVILICLYSIILLEGNAIRSALALSLFILCVYNFVNGKTTKASIILFISTTMHLQSLYFVVVFSITKIIFTGRALKNNKFFALTILAFLLSGLIFNQISNVLFSFFHKLSFYGGQGSGSAGVNSLTMISFAVVLLISKLLVDNRKVIFSYDNPGKEYALLILSCLPMLSIYIFTTNISVIGDRLWQWGIIVFCLSYFGLTLELGKKKTNIIYYIPILLMLFVGLINITIRYPLTNYFYPVLPYVDFSAVL